MKLHWSPRSPFVRKVMIVAHDIGVAGRIECVRTVAAMMKPHPDLMIDNPLSKIPTLVLDDGTVLYDSAVICEYLDHLHDGPKLFPAPFRRADDRAAPPGAGRRAARRPGAVARRAFAAGGAAVAALSQELFGSQRGDARCARARNAGAGIERLFDRPCRDRMRAFLSGFPVCRPAMAPGSSAARARGTRRLRPAHRSAPPSPSTTPRARCGRWPRRRPSP